MIDVYFYNITKRLNSTARPTGTGTKIECAFKENTSLLNPVLTLQLSTKPDYNYFKIDNRYYWITDIVSVAYGRWMISGRIDALATLKGHIQATSAFVLYDSTANTQLPDERLAVKTDCVSYTATAEMPFDYNLGSGTYLIATTGDPNQMDINSDIPQHNIKNGTGVYTIGRDDIASLGFDVDDLSHALYTEWHNFYVKTENIYNNIITTIIPPKPSSFSSLDDIMEWIGDISNWLALKISATVYLFFYILREPLQFIFILIQNLLSGGTALQNIKASYWIPFTIPASAVQDVSSKPLALGAFSDTISNLGKLKTAVIRSSATVSIPWHYSDWRNASCTEVFLYIPLIGCISIPSSVVKGHNSLTIIISINLYSGSIAVEVQCDGAQIGTYGTNCAMPFLIGDSNLNITSLVNTVVNASAQNYAGAIASGMNTVSNMATSVGGIGGGAGTGLTDNIVCICRVHETSQEPSALINTIGTPTYQLKTLSGSGYCQTLNAQLNCSSITGEPDPTQTEIEIVNNMLNTGVYLE